MKMPGVLLLALALAGCGGTPEEDRNAWFGIDDEVRQAQRRASCEKQADLHVEGRAADRKRWDEAGSIPVSQHAVPLALVWMFEVNKCERDTADFFATWGG